MEEEIKEIKDKLKYIDDNVLPQMRDYTTHTDASINYIRDILNMLIKILRDKGVMSSIEVEHMKKQTKWTIFDRTK